MSSTFSLDFPDGCPTQRAFNTIQLSVFFIPSHNNHKIEWVYWCCLFRFVPENPISSLGLFSSTNLAISTSTTTTTTTPSTQLHAPSRLYTSSTCTYPLFQADHHTTPPHQPGNGWPRRTCRTASPLQPAPSPCFAAPLFFSSLFSCRSTALATQTAHQAKETALHNPQEVQCLLCPPLYPLQDRFRFRRRNCPRPRSHHRRHYQWPPARPQGLAHST